MNNNYENLPAVLNANQLATALGISRAGVSVGSSRPRFVGSNEPLFVGKPEANR